MLLKLLPIRQRRRVGEVERGINKLFSSYFMIRRQIIQINLVIKIKNNRAYLYHLEFGETHLRQNSKKVTNSCLLEVGLEILGNRTCDFCFQSCQTMVVDLFWLYSHWILKILSTHATVFTKNIRARDLCQW